MAGAVAVIWRDGVICDAAPATNPVGVSSGVFTTVGCDHGRPLLWSRHRARLAASMQHLEPQLPEAVLPDAFALENLLRCHRLGSMARVRVVAQPSGAAWRVEASCVAVDEGGPRLPPVALVSMRWTNVPPGVGHKMLMRAQWDRAGGEARRQGFDDALLLDAGGSVMETSVANIFARFGAVVVTPEAPQRCLPGVMRAWLLEHLPAIGLAAEVGPLPAGRVSDADELWISNAVIGVRRVERIGGRGWRSWPAFERLYSLPIPAPGWQR